MIVCVMRSPQISSEKFFDQAARAAISYGFSPVHRMLEDYRSAKRTKISLYNSPNERNFRHLSALLRFCFERSLHTADHPLLVFHSNIDHETKKAVTSSKRPEDAYFTLTVIGVPGPYAEALVLSCANRIFHTLRSKQHRIRINSMGSSEDAKRYFSKLSKTLRKVHRNMRPECRKLIEKDQIIEAHPMLHDSSHAGVAEYITQTLRLLSDGARQHFEQTIEYLEAHDLSYELAPDLVEVPSFGVHTVFEIVSNDSLLRARGGRYNSLPYHVYRRKVPVVSLTMTLPEEKVSGTHILKSPGRRPRAFFLHAGEKARLRSLYILSKLCDVNIPVAHRLHCTRVFDQLNDHPHSYPYTIIFGQEEVENNILRVRRTDTRASSIVHLNDESLHSIKDFMRG